CNKLLNGKIKSTYVPFAMLGMTIFGVDLYFAGNGAGSAASDVLMSVEDFLKSFSNLRILFDLLLISVCAGLYIVPLYAIMQHDSEAAHRARIIAANNVINAFFMVLSAVATLYLLDLSFTIPQ